MSRRLLPHATLTDPHPRLTAGSFEAVRLVSDFAI